VCQVEQFWLVSVGVHGDGDQLAPDDVHRAKHVVLRQANADVVASDWRPVLVVLFVPGTLRSESSHRCNVTLRCPTMASPPTSVWDSVELAKILDDRGSASPKGNPSNLASAPR